jgi:flagellin-like hook-associated protein FlgL
MADVVLTAALRSNLQALQLTQSLIDTTQLRLSTGKKVNSALDNPQNFFAAQSLSNRAGDLSRLLDGIGQSIQTIKAADDGITGLTSLVNQASSIAEEARSEIRAAEGFATITGTADLSQFDDLVADSGGAIANGDDIRISYTSSSVTAVNLDINIATGDTIYDIVGTINSTTAINPYIKASVDENGRLKLESRAEGGLIRIGDQPGGTSLGADGFAFLGLGSVVGTENFIAATRQTGTIIAGRVLESAASGAGTVNNKYQASATLDAANYISTGDTVGFEIIVDGTSSGEISVSDTSTIQNLLDGINNDTELAGKVVASFDVDTGRIKLTFDDSVGQAEIVVNATAASDDTAFGFGFGLSDLTGAGAATSDATSEIFNFVGSSANLVQYRDDYNNVLEQIDDLVEDSNYRGVNLLGGDNLETFFNEDRTNSLVTRGSDLGSAGLGLDEVTFLTEVNVQAAIDATDAALESVRNFGATLSTSLSIIQTREEFTKGLVSTLTEGSDKLTLADQNEEGAKLLSLQTRQQLGVTALSLAAQSQQAILRLF